MKKVTRRFFSDASHGWLSVKYQELVDLGIEGQISPYSYVKGKSAYLEEDQDMSLYLKAKEAAGFEIVFDKRDHGDRSVIRRYEPFPSKMKVEETEEETETEKEQSSFDTKTVIEEDYSSDFTDEVIAATKTHELIREEELAA